MSKDLTQCCVSCRCFEPNGGRCRDDEKKDRYGECRAKSPDFPAHSDGYARWPTVRFDWWCGEQKPLEPVQRR